MRCDCECSVTGWRRAADGRQTSRLLFVRLEMGRHLADSNTTQTTDSNSRSSQLPPLFSNAIPPLRCSRATPSLLDGSGRQAAFFSPLSLPPFSLPLRHLSPPPHHSSNWIQVHAWCVEVSGSCSLHAAQQQDGQEATGAGVIRLAAAVNPIRPLYLLLCAALHSPC